MNGAFQTADFPLRILRLRREAAVPRLREKAPFLGYSFGPIEFFAGVPGAFPVLFLSPRFGFEKMKITRRAGQFREMPHRHERFVNEIPLHLFAVELKAESVVVGIRVEGLTKLID